MNPSLIITDYDGTLAGNHGVVSAQNRKALELLGQQNHVRVIATGRNLYSVHKVIDRKFPVDYVIFTTGAGIIHWPTQKIVLKHHLNEELVRTAFSTFKKHEVDFMIHNPIPDNHFFQYFNSGKANDDYQHRKEHYKNYCRPGDPKELPNSATQFVGVLREDQTASVYEAIKNEIVLGNVVRATSPFSHKNIWVEIFAKEASKQRSAEFLMQELSLDHDQTVAIGNDYNDIDLLSWAKKSFAVKNAIDELKERYEVVDSADNNGFSQAMKRFLKPELSYHL